MNEKMKANEGKYIHVDVIFVTSCDSIANVTSCKSKAIGQY